MIDYKPPKVARSIPVIDIAGSFSPHLEDCKKVACEVHEACRETGFFYVSGHRVPQSLIDAQFEVARCFFALPDERKLTLHMRNSPSTAGYEPIGGQILDSQDAASDKAPPDLKESFYAVMDLPDDHPWARKRIRGYGHNQWPAELSGFREQTIAYQTAVRELGDRVLGILALSLDLPRDYFAQFYDMPGTTLRLIRYPPHPTTALGNQLGAGAHTDWGGVTLLAQDSLGGLEVRTVDDEWVQARPIPGTFVVNLGDLMQRWTNGLYRSNMHRVKNNSSTEDRYSIPFFYGPRPDARIECLPTCTSGDRPPQFATCTAAEHLYEMFRRSYGYAPIEPQRSL
jgi:isopenicillin N synthase-like dioxygenase